jgi:hypothetical protein
MALAKKATIFKFRHGTEAQHQTFVGAEYEVTIKKTDDGAYYFMLHDGVTPGGTSVTGPKGDVGLKGDTGPKGDTGEPFRVDAVGTIAGRPSHVSKPIGFSYLATDTGNLYLVTATGWSDAIPFGKGDKGDKGDQGVAGEITSASASTGAAGSSVVLSLGGTPSKRTMAFTIPRGDKGDQGVAGEITSASASTGAAGSSVVLSLGGTPSKRTMAFTIPRGDKGEKGDKGDKGDPGEDSTGLVIGTTAGTACAGNDSRLSNSRKCNNTFDSAATSRTNLGLGSKALGEQTISTDEPSGGSHGDVWYKI